MEDSDTWPKLVEVPAPCLASRILAVSVGTTELVKRYLDEYCRDKDWAVDVVSDDDLSASISFFEGLVEDPVYLFAQHNILSVVDSYEEAKAAYDILVGDVSSIKNDLRGKIIETILYFLEAVHDEMIDGFHKTYGDLTVFVTEDGRIAVGRYENK